MGGGAGAAAELFVLHSTGELVDMRYIFDHGLTKAYTDSIPDVADRCVICKVSL